ncbi:hypothetical protein [Bremerella sp. P1]|uniref:hypothetical protein n=1 Tax=Bremerella sp. P1 TaxID=3026424 RepID=UPI00236762DC|nr:hypothetical protein [Bremerella sp. P1]WDI44785.1 hypothetical protein PSR63_12650 [Bremerella sp. P1]
MSEQAQVRAEEQEAKQKRSDLEARIEVISNARNDETFAVNAIWALRVFTLVARKLTGDEMSDYPKGEAPLHKIDWSSLPLAKLARDRKAPSLLAIGMVENMLTVKGGWVDLLDRVQKVDGFRDKGEKKGDEEPPEDPSHAEALKDLENFGKSE